MLNGPIDIGDSSISIGDKAPKVAGLVGGSPAARGNIKPGDRVYSVDGHSIESVAQFEAEMAKKTRPGEVVLRVGRTKAEANDVRIVFSD
jgi:C-terminal processing protease CtpA/Prc